MCTTTYVKYLGRKLKFDCIKSFTNISSSSSVSKTTRELQLFWSESHDPVSVATDLKMPQFTIEKVAPTVCNEQFHMGEGEDGKQFLSQLPVKNLAFPAKGRRLNDFPKKGQKRAAFLFRIILEVTGASATIIDYSSG